MTVHAEEDVLVHHNPSIPFLDLENNISPDSFHAFEVISTTFIAEGAVIPKPRLSENCMMIARVMLGNGYKIGSGIGQKWQGLPKPIQISKARETYWLGFKPSSKDIKRRISQLREKRLAKLEGRDPNTPGLGPIPHISATFPTPTYVYQPELLHKIEKGMNELSVNEMGRAELEFFFVSKEAEFEDPAHMWVEEEEEE